jgi:hypothetical protein
MQGTAALGCVAIELVPILRLSDLRKRKAGERERCEKKTTPQRRAAN